MGLQERKQKTKQRILATAEHLFTTQGFAKTTMNDVARDSELGVGTLYNYYPSKTDLMIAIFREKLVAEPMLELVVQLQELSLADKISRILDMALRPFLSVDRALLRESVSIALGFEGNREDVSPAHLMMDQQLFQLIAEAFNQAIQADELPATFPVETAIRNIYANVVSLVMMYLVDAATKPSDVRHQLHQQVLFVIGQR